MQTMVQKQIKACVLSYIRARRTARSLKASWPVAHGSALEVAACAMRQARFLKQGAN